MFESLFAKTFSILSLQLAITWATTVYTINVFRDKYAEGKWGLQATKNAEGELDIHLDFQVIKPYFWTLLIVDIAIFLVLLNYGQNNLMLGLPLFSVWSWLTGVELGLCLISVDENLGAKVLAITASITLGTAVYGMSTTSDLSFLGPILFLSLMILIAFNIIRLLFSISRTKQRIMACFGCVIFTGYLIYDFNILAQAAKEKALNTWPVAMNLAINLYLDIINLFLEILDAMSD